MLSPLHPLDPSIHPPNNPRAKAYLTLDTLSEDIILSILWRFFDINDDNTMSLLSKTWLWRREKTRSMLSMIHPATGQVDRRAFKYLGPKSTPGTEGTCYKVCYYRDGKVYAMRRAKPQPQVDGVPYYMLRELEFLRTLKHPNVSSCVSVSLYENKLTVFLPYAAYTLLQAINPTSNPEGGQPLPLSCTRALLYQVLRAVACCHGRGIVHRNIKPKHLVLVGPHSLEVTACLAACEPPPLVVPEDLRLATVQLSDFALVRTSCNPVRRFTPEVVTLWYRAPEILLGGDYSTPVDMWSVGCVFAEMLIGRPIFPGMCEIDQLFQIFSALGTPTEATWPGFSKLPNVQFEFPHWLPRPPSCVIPALKTDPVAADLLAGLLALDPRARLSASAALAHPFFDAVRDEIEARLGRTEPGDYLAHLHSLDGPRFSLASSNRAALIDWLFDVVADFDMSARTVFLAFEFAGRFQLVARGVDLVAASLFAATFLHMASKCEDISYIGVEDLVNRVRSCFSAQDLIVAEEKILRALDFSLAAATTIDFVHVYAQMYPQTSMDLCLYLAELSLYSSALDAFPRSAIAQAIVCLAGLPAEDEGDDAQWLTRFDEHNLEAVIDELARLHHGPAGAPFRHHLHYPAHPLALRALEALAAWERCVL